MGLIIPQDLFSLKFRLNKDSGRRGLSATTPCFGGTDAKSRAGDVNGVTINLLAMGRRKVQRSAVGGGGTHRRQMARLGVLGLRRVLTVGEDHTDQLHHDQNREHLSRASHDVYAPLGDEHSPLVEHAPRAQRGRVSQYCIIESSGKIPYP